VSARAPALALGLALALAAVPGLATASRAPVAITVDAHPGQVGRVAAGLQRSGLKVQRRVGRRLQVVADAGRATALERIPGVADAHPATSSFADSAPAVSQGVERTGSDVLSRVADGGAGLTIAVLDLGFGQNIARMQGLDELPPADHLETLSFDAAGGLAGTNAYGNRTNHGELVAQTVYDYAPSARYLFVNYHSEADFLAATDALIARHPDIVVHSNSFIEGPFDGTSPSARAVDRAAASGILWFNSAGNYARLHWAGPWVDANADGALDWPNGDNWTFTRSAGQPITFALSWPAPASGPPTDIDLALQRQEADGSWTSVAVSTDRQSDGAPPAERITGYTSPVDGVFRLRAVRVSGPEPSGVLSLFSREIALADIGGTVAGSVPTPGDARGAIAVGATDWRGNSLKSYSGQGPTADGRLKPDLTAPTNTRVQGPTGPHAVGGTSNAAPNAAGAAAVLIAAQRRSGITLNADEVRSQLSGLALDLGAPGPDQAFGAGRIRVSTDPPRITAPAPAVLASVRGRATVRFTGLSRSRITTWTLAVDGSPASRLPQAYPRGITIDTRRLADGWHALRAEVHDFPGNVGALDWSIRVDNTPPTVLVRRVVVGRAAGPLGARATRPRPVRLVLSASDAGTTGRLEADLTVSPKRRGRTTRTLRFLSAGSERSISLGRLARGRYVARIDLRDRAGNTTTLFRDFIVR
jgi:hypothetical protein